MKISILVILSLLNIAAPLIIAPAAIKMRNLINHAPNTVRFHRAGPLQANIGDAHIITELPIVDLATSTVHVKWVIQQIQLKHSKDERYSVLNETVNTAINIVESIVGIVGLSTVYQEQLSDATIKKQQKFLHHRDGTKLPPPSLFYTDKSQGFIADRVLSRTKRFLGLLGAAAAAGFGFLASTIISAYTVNDLSAIRHATNVQADRLNLVTHSIQELDTQVGHNLQAIDRLADQMASNFAEENIFDLASAVTTQVAVACNHMQTTVNALQDKRADSSLFPIARTRRALQDVKERSALLGLTPITERAIDLAQLPASHVSDLSGRIVVFIHVPLSSDRFQMTLYKLSSLPMQTENGWFNLALEQQYLSVTQHPTSTFYSMNENEFQKCIQTEDQYICPHVHALMKPDASTTGASEPRCLHALFSRDNNGILEHCEMKPVGNREEIVQLGEHEFGFYTAKKTNIRIS
jgi:hypothetical protein